MKRLFFDYIWQWVDDDVVGINPIGIELEYNKFGPEVSLSVVLMGVGFTVTVVLPWDTKESAYAKQYANSILSFFSEIDNVPAKGKKEEEDTTSVLDTNAQK